MMFNSKKLKNLEARVKLQEEMLSVLILSSAFNLKSKDLEILADMKDQLRELTK